MRDSLIVSRLFDKDTRHLCIHDIGDAETVGFNMATETGTQTVYFNTRNFPLGVTIGGRTVGSSVAPKAPRYLELCEDIDTEITDLGKQFKDLHTGSITAQKIQRLHNYWLLGEAGEVQISEPHKRVLDYLFNKFGKGIVLDNGVDYNDQGDLPEKEGYARARIVTQPKRFHRESGEWEVEAGEIKPVHGYVPPTGFTISTNDGIYNPDIFVPFATTSERTDAVASHIAKGVSPEVAEKAVSKFWSRNEGDGVAVVDAFCDDGSDCGRFCLDTDNGPGVRYDDIGRLASRSRKTEADNGQLPTEPATKF